MSEQKMKQDEEKEGCKKILANSEITGQSHLAAFLETSRTLWYTSKFDNSEIRRKIYEEVWMIPNTKIR